MDILRLRYGLNPHQAFAELRSPKPSPITVLSGAPGTINFLDALRGWKLVRELRRRFARPAAASFKHVNPAGVGVGGEYLGASFLRAHFLPDRELSPLAFAYLRARQADRIASYGDFIALSDTIDFPTAQIIKSVASGRRHRPRLRCGRTGAAARQAGGALHRAGDRPGLRAGGS
jgi:phosphoribosylaminoimidazolecarboxamide formyltransferase/IMP cyclohydrolase